MLPWCFAYGVFDPCIWKKEGIYYQLSTGSLFRSKDLEHWKHLHRFVENEERINGSMRRILTGKFKLGLFENPYVDPDQAEKIVNCEPRVMLEG